MHSKPVKNSIIAENEEVQQLVEKCLKARGKWQVDETMEEVNPCLKSNSLLYPWNAFKTIAFFEYQPSTRERVFHSVFKHREEGCRVLAVFLLETSWGRRNTSVRV